MLVPPYAFAASERGVDGWGGLVIQRKELVVISCVPDAHAQGLSIGPTESDAFVKVVSEDVKRVREKSVEDNVARRVWCWREDEDGYGAETAKNNADRYVSCLLALAL
jgi:hypothetical protein